MKLSQRFFAIVSLLCLFASLLPTSAFADADDFTEPDMYKILYEALKEHPDYEVAQLMSRCVDESGKEVQAPLKNSGNTVILKQRDYFKELLLHKGDSSFCTKLFRRKIVRAHRFMLNRLNEDFELLLRMMPEISGIVTVEQVGYNIVLSTQSVTRGKYNQKLYAEVRKILDQNKQERHIRGGMATRRKYKGR